MKFKSIMTTLALSSVILLVSVQPASAFISFETLVLASLSTIETVVLGLSADIGLMADRIGEMADRIVTTEQMLVDITTNGVTCK